MNYLRVDPIFAANIFKCCTTLCNIARDGDQEILEFEGQEEGYDAVENFIENPANEAPVGAQARLQEFIEYFRIN